MLWDELLNNIQHIKILIKNLVVRCLFPSYREKNKNNSSRTKNQDAGTLSIVLVNAGSVIKSCVWEKCSHAWVTAAPNAQSMSPLSILLTTSVIVKPDAPIRSRKTFWYANPKQYLPSGSVTSVLPQINLPTWSCFEAHRVLTVCVRCCSVIFLWYEWVIRVKFL